MRLQLLPMARRFRAIAACRHVAPATTTVLRVIEEHALTARIRTSSHAGQLSEDQRIGRRFDDRDDESSECVADRNERANERPVGTKIDASSARAPTEHTVDFNK